MINLIDSLQKANYALSKLVPNGNTNPLKGLEVFIEIKELIF